MKSNFSSGLNVKTFVSMANKRFWNGLFLKFTDATFATPGCISSAFTVQKGFACAIIEANKPHPVPISRQCPFAFDAAHAPNKHASVLIFNPGFPCCNENCLNSKRDLFSAIVRRIFAPVLGFPLQDFGGIMIAL